MCIQQDDQYNTIIVHNDPFASGNDTEQRKHLMFIKTNDDWDKYKDLILKNKGAPYLFEYYHQNTLIKPTFDIEKYIDADTCDELCNEEEAQLFNSICEICRKEFPDCLIWDLVKKPRTIIKKGKAQKKISLHIIVEGYATKVSHM